jgi:pimeloyl-ACP methyl ester carboxylesterase
VPAGARPGWFRTDDGLRLRWLAWGPREAPTLVLLHGLRSYAATFESLARRLSESWRCVALDARGRGGSDWDPRCDYHTGRYVSDLSQLVDRLGLERFVLLGHSMGGATAMVWAAAHPGRLDALIVEDMLPGSSVAGEGADRIRREVAAIPSGFADRADAIAYWRRLRPAAPDSAIRSRVHHTTRPAGPDTAELRWIPDMAGIGAARLDPSRPPVDLWPTIERLPARTLLVRGADSDFTHAETATQVRRINPDVVVTVIEGAGHYVHDDQPGPFADCVEAFLAK